MHLKRINRSVYPKKKSCGQCPAAFISLILQSIWHYKELVARVNVHKGDGELFEALVTS